MIIVIMVAAVGAVVGIVILAGKGDGLIAGYNTASPEEREKYDIRRLRLLMGGVLVAIAPLCLLLNGDADESSVLVFTAAVVALAVVSVILANTWARK